MMLLNLPQPDFRIRSDGGKQEIFDTIRRKYVRLTSEEWVRQHFLHFLVNQLRTPASLISVEASIKVNGLAKRCDIVVHNSSGKPLLIVECKATEVDLTQEVFDQVARYNMTLMVPFLVVTNGMDHFVCHIDHENRSYSFLKEIPPYEKMVK